MQTTWKEIGRNTRLVLQLMLAAAAVALIFFLFPKVNRFQYDFEKGKPWQYEDLISPFNFSLLKDEATLAEEREQIKSKHNLHFTFNQAIASEVIDKYYSLLTTRINQIGADETETFHVADVEAEGNNLLDSLLNYGLIEEKQEVGDQIVVMKDGVAIKRSRNSYMEVKKAKQFIENYHFDSEESKEVLVPILTSVVEANVVYDEALNQSILEAKLSKVATTKGLIQKGEKVVENGDIIDSETYNKLVSLEQSYQEKVMGTGQQRILSIGYLLAISLTLSILILYLFYFRKQVFFNFRHYFFILLLIVGFLMLTSVVIKNNLFFLYAIPFCIVPIVLRAFFGRELAIYVHLIIIIIAGLFVPKPFEFIFIQLIAGIIAIYGNKNVRYWSQFFKAIGFIFVAYILTYVAMYLIETSDLKSIEVSLFGALAINAFLTFLAYPLIPFFEKLFGLISEISLVEYTDLNKPILKKLSLEAPGTFQHSLQVANLAEAATSEVGGNALLVKVGGLYHDIGKLSQPRYFIENQSPNNNPHQQLNYEQSAEIIIAHVTDGIKMAKKQGLPAPIIEFIKTHHGTTRVEYFYRLHTQENVPENVDEDKFIYPGPRPYTKEQAILMMADSVEAASKSLKNPDEKSINDLVDSIVAHQIDRGQFDDAPISFKEISTCKKVFKKMLASINHIRVEYPEEEK